MSNSETWETQEVINWLINDEFSYSTLQGAILRHYDAEDLKDPDTLEIAASKVDQWTKEENAPSGLYESFGKAPVSSFDNVDRTEVVKSIVD
jgi:hypothetical protein